MSSAEHSIPPHLSVEAARQILQRAGQAQLPVIDRDGSWIGVISQHDLDLAVHYGFSHAPVKEHLAVYPAWKLAQPSATAFPSRAHPEMATLLRRCLVPALWKLLTRAAEAAEAHGWQLFLVGGAVRDLLLAMGQDPLWKEATGQAREDSPNRRLVQDIDLVVDGLVQPTIAGAGVELARSLQAQYPQARLEIHGKFQTAALLWHNDPVLRSLWVDIATARTEFYPYPAANPIVAASSIQQDLDRRDFTINALAIRLTQPNSGELLDVFGGIADLQTRQIRVLHANSFIEDPTRIYRAVRFAVRLGFKIEPQTQGYMRHALASGIYQQVRDRPTNVFPIPALQTRLKAELKYIFQSAYALPALHLLAQLGALQCIHPSLEANADLWRQLRLVLRLVNTGQKAEGNESEAIIQNSTSNIHYLKSVSPTWLLPLELLLSHVASEHRRQVAEGFQLPVDSIERLDNLAAAEPAIAVQLRACDRPSQTVQCLQSYSPEMLILIAVRGDRPLRKTIARYLTEWSEIKSPLDGSDLKALGYKPGKQFKDMLAAITAATLDGEITSREAATAFLEKYYPVTGEG